MSVLIAVPTFENITPDTFKAIWDMGRPEGTDFEFVRGYDCATARNKIVQKAIDGGYSHVLMVDNDVTPPRDALVNLLEHDVDVVLGWYAHRNASNEFNGNTNICRLYQPSGEAYFHYPRESEYTFDEMAEMAERGEYLIPVHGGGMGCALIKTSVIERLKYPWYDWVNYADGNRGMLSEDLFFCENCKFHHVPVYADTRVGCGHMFRKVVRP